MKNVSLFLLTIAPLVTYIPNTHVADHRSELRGYYVSKDALRLKVPSIENTYKFRVTIDRSYKTSEEKKVIEFAEAFYPPRKAIIMHDPEPDFSEMRLFDKALLINDKDVWWFDYIDGIRVPFAITKGAIAYYVAVTKAFKEKQFRSPSGFRMTSSELKYSAVAEKIDDYSFPNVYRVHLSLYWSQGCGQSCCGVWTKGRELTINGSGRVFTVEGDGNRTLEMSAC